MIMDKPVPNPWRQKQRQETNVPAHLGGLPPLFLQQPQIQPRVTMSESDVERVRSQYVEQFTTLQSLGFTDDATNASLLEFYNGNVEAVIEHLMQNPFRARLE